MILYDAVAVYRRARDKGRMLPDGLRYVSTWEAREAITPQL